MNWLNRHTHFIFDKQQHISIVIGGIADECLNNIKFQQQQQYSHAEANDGNN